MTVTVNETVLGTTEMAFGDMVAQAPYAVWMLDVDGAWEPTTAETDGARLVYANRAKNGMFRTVKTELALDAETVLHVVDPEQMLEHAATIGQMVTGVTRCQHDHDYTYAVAQNADVDRPRGVSWAYGWIRRPGMGRDCPVCTPKATRNACGGNTRATNGYSVHRDTTLKTCGERHAAWGKKPEDAAAKAKAEADKAEAEARVLAAAAAVVDAATEAPAAPKRATRKRAAKVTTA